jgi:hypothetical protein
MITYNVTVKLNPSIEQKWKQWMLEKHMPAILATKCFDAYALHKLIDHPDDEGITYVAQYFAPDYDHYTNYIDLRAEGLALFGDQFIAFRTVMEKQA